MRWYQPFNEPPPSINPTDSNGDYRPEYVEWLRNLNIETWDEIRNCLESGAYEYAEWDKDKDGFTIRLFADKKESGDGFDYIFSVSTNVYLDDETWWDVETTDMHTDYWHHAQACAFMWQSDPEEWTMGRY